MKVFIVAIAVLLIFSSFFLFSVSSDMYLATQEDVKNVANDAAHAGALYYDTSSFSVGVKIYQKNEGNQAVQAIVEDSLKEDPVNIFITYFDGDGTLTSFKNGMSIKNESITFPYLFKESLTGYTRNVNAPTVIVTLEMKDQKFFVPWVNLVRLARTSAYEEPAIEQL